MIQEHIDWLKGLGPQATAQDLDDAKMQKKNAILSKLAGDVELLRGQMIENSKIEVRNKKGKTQKIVNYEVRDQTTEFDMDEMREGYALGQVITEDMTREEMHEALEDTADMEKHLETKRIVETMIRQLEEENPGLFDKEDLINEVYQPLLRQGLIGETFIPNEFSQTKEMLEKTFEDYGKRLQESESKGLWDENKDLFWAGLGLGVGIAGGVSSSIAASQFAQHGAPDSSWGTQSFNSGLTQTNADKTMNTGTEAATIAGYVGWGATTGQMLYESKEDMPKIFGGPEKDKPGRISVAPQIAQAVAGGLASQLGTELAGVGLGLAGSSSFGAIVKVSAIATQLGGKDFASGNVDSVCDMVSAAYVEVLAVIDPGDDGTVSQKLTQAGAKMRDKYRSSLAADKIVAGLQESEAKKLDVGKMVQLFLEAGTAALAVGKPLIEPLIQDPATKKKITDKVNKKISEDFLKEDSDRDKKAKKELEDLKNVGDVKTEASRLDKKIAALNREQAILKWSFGVAGLGMQVASQVLAPLAIAGSAIGIAQNLIQAGKRARDAIVFIESRKGMLNAASAYSSAVSNFVTNANTQLVHYSIQAAFQVASMIGSILQCTGILAAAGAAVSAGAGIGQSLEAMIYAARKRMDLETAWKEYKLALSRPENRKLGLLAIKSNPTLAKYAVAWGAVIKKDPLVKDVLHDCGLSAATIEEDTTTHKVVKYLEARMPDDNVVDGRKLPSADFAPSPIVLTAECWASAKARAVAKAHLMPKDTRSIDSALEQFGAAATELKSAMEELEKKMTAAKPPNTDKKLITGCDDQIKLCEAAIQTCMDVLPRVKKGFESYTPVEIDDKGDKVGGHTKMEAVVGDFVSLIDQSTQGLDKKADEVKQQKDLVATWAKA